MFTVFKDNYGTFRRPASAEHLAHDGEPFLPHPTSLLCDGGFVFLALELLFAMRGMHRFILALPWDHFTAAAKKKEEEEKKTDVLVKRRQGLIKGGP